MSKRSERSRALTKWLVSEHDLEIETGRFNWTKIPREQRWCSHCQKKSGALIIGGEKHALSECGRVWGKKCNNWLEVVDRLEREKVELQAGYFYELIPELQMFSTELQFLLLGQN